VFGIDGPQRVTAPIAQMPIIMLPDRRDVKVAR
jgi:acetone carboxylase alpha subunit